MKQFKLFVFALSLILSFGSLASLGHTEEQVVDINSPSGEIYNLYLQKKAIEDSQTPIPPPKQNYYIQTPIPPPRETTVYGQTPQMIRMQTPQMYYDQTPQM